ncbi:hypothetical protein [Maritalea porphyrae]|uniref:hypothetical protein n=1 Tax=Maritalea porphyrae TaxID=880732 RepID=UPI0022AFCCEA|nr:hypothetical protein [Maritalea porphyrae]MCZ4270739.1 hypothetical protein [Maritalea porphyrae]
MTITPDQLVSREVHYCVSSLVHTLASSSAGHGDDPLNILLGQAHGLFTPLYDYESAAREANWEFDEKEGHWWRVETSNANGLELASTAENACAIDDIEPHETEILEHWIVSNWLAEQLEAKGQRVDNDFAGLTVWARTTSGQAISQDYVIQQIHAELVK